MRQFSWKDFVLVLLLVFSWSFLQIESIGWFINAFVVVKVILDTHHCLTVEVAIVVVALSQNQSKKIEKSAVVRLDEIRARASWDWLTFDLSSARFFSLSVCRNRVYLLILSSDWIVVVIVLSSCHLRTFVWTSHLIHWPDYCYSYCYYYCDRLLMW